MIPEQTEHHMQKTSKSKQKKHASAHRPYSLYKTNPRCVIDLSMKGETTKLLEYNIGENLDRLGHSSDFLDTTPKAQSMKKKITDKLNIIKIKNFCKILVPYKAYETKFSVLLNKHTLMIQQLCSLVFTQSS